MGRTLRGGSGLPIISPGVGGRAEGMGGSQQRSRLPVVDRVGELWRERPLTVMANERRAPGLIQRYRKELQTRHYARRTVKT
jgi:hypothetical protein